MAIVNAGIMTVVHIEKTSPDTFVIALRDKIDEFEKKGYLVEVHYAVTNSFYSALLVVRHTPVTVKINKI